MLRVLAEIPKDPVNAPVWREIADHIDEPGFEGTMVSVADAPRTAFAAHPWAIGGGGATELKEVIDESSALTLGSQGEIGVLGMTNADDVMLAPARAFARMGVELAATRELLVGECLRDWTATMPTHVVFPYTSKLQALGAFPGLSKWL